MPVAEAALLIDAGPIVASLVANEPAHDACNRVLEVTREAWTCWPVVTEAAYLLGDYSPAGSKMFELLHNGTWRLAPLGLSDLAPVEAILDKYADQGFQLADACLMHLAERDGFSRVLTLDRKDFSVFRTDKGGALTLLP